MNPYVLIILAASIVANVALGRAYLGQRDDATAAETALRDMQGQRDGAREAASACSDAVEDLRTLADKRHAAAALARAAAASAARDLQQRADYTLGLKPRIPTDACASMQVLGDEWLAGRVRP